MIVTVLEGWLSLVGVAYSIEFRNIKIYVTVFNCWLILGPYFYSSSHIRVWSEYLSKKKKVGNGKDIVFMVLSW